MSKKRTMAGGGTFPPWTLDVATTGSPVVLPAGPSPAPWATSSASKYFNL